MHVSKEEQQQVEFFSQFILSNRFLSGPRKLSFTLSRVVNEKWSVDSFFIDNHQFVITGYAIHKQNVFI